MVTVEQICDEFPEFRRAGHDLIAAKLADALMLTASTFGSWSAHTRAEGDAYVHSIAADPPHTVRDLYVKYLTASLLVLTPAGEFARLDPRNEPDGARSIYERQCNQLMARLQPLAMVL